MAEQPATASQQRQALLERLNRLREAEREVELSLREIEGTPEWAEEAKRRIDDLEHQLETAVQASLDATAEREQAIEQRDTAVQLSNDLDQALTRKNDELEREHDRAEELAAQLDQVTTSKQELADDLRLAETERDNFRQQTERLTADLEVERKRSAIRETRLSGLKGKLRNEVRAHVRPMGLELFEAVLADAEPAVTQSELEEEN